jgi:hypothetical protein
VLIIFNSLSGSGKGTANCVTLLLVCAAHKRIVGDAGSGCQAELLQCRINSRFDIKYKRNNDMGRIFGAEEGTESGAFAAPPQRRARRAAPLECTL